MVKANFFGRIFITASMWCAFRMPPLRDRSEDIPAIVDFWLQNLQKQRRTRISRIARKEAIMTLRRYRWPGNVRELENVIYRSAVIAQGDTTPGQRLAARDSGWRGAAPAPAPDPAVALAAAYDLIFEKAAADGTPILPAIEAEMIARAHSGPIPRIRPRPRSGPRAGRAAVQKRRAGQGGERPFFCRPGR